MAAEWINTALSMAGPIILSSLVGALSGLWAFKQQTKERISAAITWEWQAQHGGGLDEEPFLVVQNASLIPSYLIRARLLKGYFWRTEVAKYAFDYAEVTVGNFPLELKAAGVTSFPLAKYRLDKEVEAAGKWAQRLGHLGRNFFWIEIRTIGGRTLTIGANDATSFQERPSWLGKS